MDCSPPGSSVHRILQARILEWVAFPSPGDLPDPGIEPGSPSLQADSLLSKPPGKVKVAQWCPTLCDPMGCIVCGILQAKILEWVAFPFSQGSPQPRDQTQVSHICRWILYQLSHKGSLKKIRERWAFKKCYYLCSSTTKSGVWL